MAKLMTFIMIAAMISIFLTLAGVSTTTGIVLGKVALGTPESSQNYDKTLLYIAIIGAITVMGAISMAKFAYGTIQGVDIIYSAGIALMLATFIGDYYAVIASVKTMCASGSSCYWTNYVVHAIFAPIIVGYAISLYDWVRGND